MNKDAPQPDAAPSVNMAKPELEKPVAGPTSAKQPAGKMEQSEIMPAQPASPASGQPDDAESAAPLQAKYPDVENRLLQTGGNGNPASSLWYPQFGNAKVDSALKAFAEAQAREYEEELKDSLGEDSEKPESWSSWEQTGFFTLERPSPDIVSVIFNVYSYIGGAHGQIVICVLNYNLKTGRLLTLADLFANPQKAIAIMSELCSQKLAASLGEDADEEMIKDGTEAVEANFSNLSLLPDGLDVEFQPYQVGPWSIGQQQVKLTLEDLAPAGPNPLVWPKAKP